MLRSTRPPQMAAEAGVLPNEAQSTSPSPTTSPQARMTGPMEPVYGFPKQMVVGRPALWTSDTK
jgi:hypothetical protein